MKYILLLFVLFQFSHLFSQDEPSEFLNNSCSFTTDGNGKSLGLKIKISTVCSWTKTEGNRPHIVKMWLYAKMSG